MSNYKPMFCEPARLAHLDNQVPFSAAELTSIAHKLIRAQNPELSFKTLDPIIDRVHRSGEVAPNVVFKLLYIFALTSFFRGEAAKCEIASLRALKHLTSISGSRDVPDRLDLLGLYGLTANIESAHLAQGVEKALLVWEQSALSIHDRVSLAWYALARSRVALKLAESPKDDSHYLQQSSDWIDHCMRLRDSLTSVQAVRLAELCAKTGFGLARVDNKPVALRRLLDTLSLLEKLSISLDTVEGSEEIIGLIGVLQFTSHEFKDARTTLLSLFENETLWDRLVWQDRLGGSVLLACTEHLVGNHADSERAMRDAIAVMEGEGENAGIMLGKVLRWIQAAAESSRDPRVRRSLVAFLEKHFSFEE